uniref:Putative secreted protein n=1 Tax=Anopheles triannulatus TaxID=58253 RepID=A0A2M4B4Q0_9DIPT
MTFWRVVCTALLSSCRFTVSVRDASAALSGGGYGPGGTSPAPGTDPRRPTAAVGSRGRVKAWAAFAPSPSPYWRLVARERCRVPCAGFPLRRSSALRSISKDTCSSSRKSNRGWISISRWFAESH